MNRISLTILLVHAWTLELSAQGEYISRGQNAFGGSLFYNTSSEANGYGLQLGYSFRGSLDAGILWTKANAGQAKGGIFSPLVTYYVVKQEDADRAPTLGVTLSYRHYRTTSTSTVVEPVPFPVTDTTKEITTIQTIDAFIFDVTAHKHLGYLNVFFFQPLLGAGISFTNSGMQFVLRGGVSIGTRMIKGPLVIFVPSFERQAGLTTLVLRLSTIF